MPYQILLACNSKVSIGTVRSYLEERNLRVTATSSIGEIVELAATLLPDVAVLDFEWPEMTGADMCETLGEAPATASVPILILSLRDDEEIRRRCKEAGAAGFVRKADGRDALLDALAKVLIVQRRKDVRLRCRMIVGAAADGPTREGEVHDVSAGGVHLKTRELLPLGQAIHLRFCLPGSEKELKCFGEVVRLDEASHALHGYGIQFLTAEPHARAALERFVERTL